MPEEPAPVIAIPTTVDDAPVEESVFMGLALIFIPEEVFEQVIPVTFPPVPVEDRLFIILDDTAIDVAALEVAPIVIPVTIPWPVILVIVFPVRLETPFQYVKFIVLIAPDPPIQLLKVFPVIVFVDPVPPSVLLNPIIELVPARVIFEKLLFV